MRTVPGISRAFVIALSLLTATAAFAADGGTWSVSKSSGEVWMGSGDVQQVSLKSDDVLKPGDTIRTGRNGRVLLVRGEESIMIAPNSVVGLPAEKKEGLSTTIIQKAGSILLEVEKKNVKHFEVETPYLAAVVKGTQFKVTVSARGTSVDVIRGQVEVSDFKSGQIAQVMAGQHAKTFAYGNAGLSLGGSGTLQPIEHGKPRASSFDRVPVPRGGLTAPGKPTSASLTPHKHGIASTPRHGVTRISSALGEVKLNVHKATHGLARGSHTTVASRSAERNNSTVWGSGNSGTSSNNSSGYGSGNNIAGNNSNSGTGNGSSNAGNASTVAAIVGSGGGNGNGNNAGGNGNGNGNNAGGNGNGNGKNNVAGNGNGNNGNGNGNNAGGNGNGNGKNNVAGNGNGNNGNGNGNGGGNGSNAGGNGNGNAGGNGNGHALGRNK